MDRNPQEPERGPDRGVPPAGETPQPSTGPGPSGPYEPPPPQPRRSGTRWLAAVLAALVLAGGVAFAAVKLAGFINGTGDVLASKVPATTDVFATVYLDPSGSQKLDLKRVLGKFPALAGRDLAAEAEAQLEQSLSSSGLSYTRDIKPWLGSQVGVAVEPSLSGAPPRVAVLIATRDDDAAAAALRRLERTGAGAEMRWSSQSRGGVEIRVGEADGAPRAAYAVLDGIAVVSNESASVGAVIDADQGAVDDLASSDVYADTTGQLPDDVLGFVYVDVAGLLPQALAGLSAEGAAQMPLGPLGAVRAMRGAAISLRAERDGLALDAAVTYDPSSAVAGSLEAISPHESPVLRYVPADAYGAFTIGDTRPALRRLVAEARKSPTARAQLDRLDVDGVLDSLTGDAGIEARPGTTRFPGAALIVGTTDEARMQRFLDTVIPVALGAAGAETPTTEDHDGVTISSVSVPDLREDGVSPAWAVAHGYAVVGTSPDQVEAVLDAGKGTNILADPTFTRTLRSADRSNDAMFYLNLRSVAGAVRAALPEDSLRVYETVIEPNLRPVRSMVITETTGDGVIRERWFILIQ